MKVLLLGKSGMLGSCFLKMLEDVECLQVEAFGKELDIRNFNKLDTEFQAFCPDLVINCAAYTDVDGAEAEKNTAFAINGDGVGNVAKACKDVGATLIHFSTDYVFDGENGDGYSEDMETSPINVYGKSKLEGERQIIKEITNYYIVRTSWLFGENGKNFVDTMLRLGDERDELSVVGDQIGSPTYTKDLCKAVINGFLMPLPFGVYHITNLGKTTWHDFANKIFELKGIHVNLKKITTEEFPRPANRPKNSSLISAKFDFSMPPWEDALRRYLCFPCDFC